jgi:4-aminobutyrate aminotransferase-like enzyme
MNNKIIENKVFKAVKFHDYIIDSTQGLYVITDDGQKLLDLNAGQFCNILGPNNNEVNKEIFKQMNIISNTNTGVLSTNVIKAAEMLNEISEGMNSSALLLSTGSEAVEVALRYAKFSKKRNGVISLDKGYHGLSLGSQSVTFAGKYAKPIVSDAYSIKTPHSAQEESESLIELENLLITNGQDIACLILEPIVSVGGMIVLSKEYLKSVRELCSKYNIYLIFDECQTGFGRTGEWFSFQDHNVIPDIVVTAKGLGLGYPVSAVLFNETTFNINSDITNYSSHQNDPFSAAVVIVGINYIKKYNILDNVRKMGNYLYNQLSTLKKEYSIITDIRGKGLMLGFDLNLGNESRRKSDEIIKKMAENGVMIQATNNGKTFRVLPAYIISESEINFFIEQLKKVLKNDK